MYLNKKKIRTLMVTKADNNYHKFAHQLGVNVAQLHRILNTNSQAGPKFLGRFKSYCDDAHISFEDYIFLEEPLTVNNTGTEG
ncbi:MAG: XRE family transcriptional regulator [Syntrophomonadaceae bacterium]|nr:XRE family transcriptional regulator [Syntrophomonadaceae bacterium]